MRLVDRGVVYTGFAAMQRLLLFSPVFWLAATISLALIPGNAAMWRRLLVAVVLTLLLPLFRPIGEGLFRLVAGPRRIEKRVCEPS